MGKAPFKYRPSKPVSSSVTAKAAEQRAGQIETVGSDEVLALYADVFVVANETGTNMASLYFYQRTLQDRAATLGGTEVDLSISRAKCISRIVLAPEAADKFLQALADNRGFVVTRKSPEGEAK